MLDVKLICDQCEKPHARAVLYSVDEVQEWVAEFEPGDGQHTCRECLDSEISIDR